MDTSAYIKFWGEKNLVRWALGTLIGSDIPSASRAFLKDVGMPAVGRKIGPYKLQWDEFFSPVDGNRRRIGWNYNVSFLVREPDGAVLRESKPESAQGGLNNMIPESLVNSSVERFAECLMEQARFSTGAAPYDVHSTDYLELLRERWTAIDPEALSTPGGYWQGAILDLEGP